MLWLKLVQSGGGSPGNGVLVFNSCLVFFCPTVSVNVVLSGWSKRVEGCDCALYNQNSGLIIHVPHVFSVSPEELVVCACVYVWTVRMCMYYKESNTWRTKSCILHVSIRWQHGQQTFVHTHAKTYRYCTDTHPHIHTVFGSLSWAEIFRCSHSWREILNNKYPANNECAAGCSCLGGIISNFLPMFHIPTPACRHSPSLHPNAGSYHFYLFFKSIYKSKPGQMRSNKLPCAGQMRNVNCVPGEKIPMGAACSVLCARGKIY